MDFNYVFFSGHFTCGCTLYKKMRHFCDIGLHPLLDYNDLTQYKAIRPTGSQRPRMHGLLKTHKKDVPLRPILSMTGSAQHELSKWLTCLLQPVLQDLSANCVSDSLTFPASSPTFRLLKPYKSAPTPCTITTSYRSHLFHVTSYRRINAAGHFLCGIQLQQQHVSTN